MTTMREKPYLTIGNSHNFIMELRDIRKHYQGRPTPVYYAKRLTDYVEGARIYLKREDLNHTGAHKLNHCMGEALLAKYLGKKKLIAETGVGQHGVEPLRTVTKLGEYAASLTYGSEGILHGFNSIMLQNKDGTPAAVHSIASGLDYPSVGPEQAYLNRQKRTNVATANDKETIQAFYDLSHYEGIIPALESSHAVAFAMKLAKEKPYESILINLSGRGDKDIDFVAQKFPPEDYM